MNEQEQTAFRSSAAVLKKAAKEMGIE